MNMDTQAGQETYSNIAGEYIREWSVGFNLPEGDAVAYDRNGNETTRRILNLDWVEVSPVLRGASPDTQTITAKSASDTTPEKSDVASDTEIETIRLGIEIERTKLDIMDKK